MQKVDEPDEAACIGNDLALIRIPDPVISQTNPSVPTFGGPVKLRTTVATAGTPAYAVSASPLYGGRARNPRRPDGDLPTRVAERLGRTTSPRSTSAAASAAPGEDVV